jgi:hypothetical protein
MKLITLGCSLTHINGWKEELALLLNCKLLNLAESAGSNGLQIYRLHEFLLSGQLNNNDIIVWQVTSDARIPMRLPGTVRNLNLVNKIQLEQFNHIKNYHYVATSRNTLDSATRIDLLCNSPLVDRRALTEFDTAQSLETLLANIILLSRAHKRMLVFLGWDRAISPNYKDVFVSRLKQHNVCYLDSTYVEWARENKLSFMDAHHPSEETSKLFASVLLPKLTEFLQ